MIPAVQIPDFAGGLLRQEQASLGRLQALAQMRALESEETATAALRDVAPALASDDPAQRTSALARLSGAGWRGAQIGLPLLQQERGAQAFNAALGAPAPAMPGGGNVRATNATFAAQRQAIMDDLNLTQEQQAAALARVSAAHSGAGGTPERPGGYRANDGDPEAGRPFVGLAAPSGVVPPVIPGQRAMPGQPSPDVFARMTALAASGGPGSEQAQRFVAMWGPFMRQNEQNPPPTVTLGPGPHGPAGVYQRNRDGSFTRLGDPPPPATTVTVGAGETAFERERGKGLAERVGEWEAAETRASQTLSRLQRFEALNRQFQTGALASTTLTAGQLAQRLGLPNAFLEGLGISPTQTASGEGLRSLTGQMLVGMIGQGGFPAQNFSNADREMLERALPSIGNTPQGNRIIGDIFRASAQRDREIGAAWREWSRTNGEGRESVMKFQQERLPAIINRDVLVPALADAFPADAVPPGAIPGPGGRGTAEPPPATHRFNPSTGRIEPVR